MNYFKKNTSKVLLAILGLFIVSLSLIYAHYLTKRLADEESKRIQLVAKAIKDIANANDFTDIGFMNDIIQSNTTIPLIVTDEKENVVFHRNIDSVRATNPSWLKKELLEMKNTYPPVELIFGSNNDKIHQKLYYGESLNLKLLRYFPLIQLALIAVFIFFAYFAFSAARSAEQDRVWVGMAKETAHQLGTPLTSLVGWIEYLKSKPNDEENMSILNDMQNDINRLSLVADRFGKIGSHVELQEHCINDIIKEQIEYFGKRMPKRVELKYNESQQNIVTFVNKPLLTWVFENLIKNALDALEGRGNIEISIAEENLTVIIDVKDSGKGIPKSNFKTVFNPGFSTKKRGWGLGLSLCKRIIEKMHNGQIFVKESAINKGTTFRIILPA